MPRNVALYLEDILISIEEIQTFALNLNNQNEFSSNIEKKRAVERNLEIIGEAIKKIPKNLLDLRSEIEWRKITG